VRLVGYLIGKLHLLLSFAILWDFQKCDSNAKWWLTNLHLERRSLLKVSLFRRVYLLMRLYGVFLLKLFSWIYLCDMWGSHKGITEDSFLLGCCDLSTDKELPTFRRIVGFTFSLKQSKIQAVQDDMGFYLSVWPWRSRHAILRNGGKLHCRK
jgi:hypothetical protein